MTRNILVKLKHNKLVMAHYLMLKYKFRAKSIEFIGLKNALYV